MLDTSKLEAKCKEFGIELGGMEVHGAYRKCFERMREGMGTRSEEPAGTREMAGSGGEKGLWMGKEIASTRGGMVE